MHYHTPGGVIESGKAIAEILPTGEPLIIEASIPRTEIDVVHKGQEATVRLTSLNARTTPILSGEVFYVSADSIVDTSQEVPQEIYLARVSVPQSQLDRVRGFTPTPGMPVEIMIQTEERTFFEYLMRPIADSMNRAFREQ
jgi:HlyD family secretion protein